MYSRLIVLLSLTVFVAQAQVRTFPTLLPPQIPSFNNWGKECCGLDTIYVKGTATIQAQPDEAQISAEAKVNADTTESAVGALAGLVGSIIKILQNNGLTQEDYKVTSFSTYANTSYINGTSQVLGQIASQAFQITIPSIKPDGSNIGKLIDQLAKVNGIILNGLNFEVANKTALYNQARKEAFADAKQRATDYLSALSLSIGKVLQMVDSFSQAPVATQAAPVMMSFAADSVNSKTSVNVGTIPIDYSVEVVYSFK